MGTTEVQASGEDGIQFSVWRRLSFSLRLDEPFDRTEDAGQPEYKRLLQRDLSTSLQSVVFGRISSAVDIRFGWFKAGCGPREFKLWDCVLRGEASVRLAGLILVSVAGAW